jgi:hypothetical protein
MDLTQQIMELAPNINKDVIEIIEKQIHSNTVTMRWMFGICSGGFFTLSGWMWWIVIQLSKKLTAESLDEKIKPLSNTLKEIHDGLLGGFKEKGLITEHYDLERKNNELEERVEKLEEKKV